MATYYTNWSKSGGSSPNGAQYTVNGKNVTYYNDVRYKFIVTEKVDKDNNKSTFVVNKYAVFYYTWDDAPETLRITMKSKIPKSASYKSETKTVTSSKSSNGYAYVGQDSFTVSHNEDGTGSTTFVGLGTYTGGSGTVYTRTVSKNLDMTKINRTSTIASNATSNTKFGDTISFSINRKNSGFTHDIKYSMYDASGTIATNVSVSQEWTIPVSLISNTPNNSNPTITIMCYTKSGNTVIGSESYSFKCLVPDDYKPLCSISIEEIGVVPNDWNVYVKGKSKLKVTVNTSKNIENDTASVKSIVSKIDNEIYQENPFSTNSLKNEGEIKINSIVTDSRGRTSEENKLIDVIDYFAPTILNCKIIRCNADGTLNDEGTYAKASIQYSIAPVDNLNSKKVKVIYGSVEKSAILSDYEGTYTFTDLFSGLETNSSYNFEFQLIDQFEVIPQSFNLTPSFVTKSLLAGGKGVTFGQVATEEGLHSYMKSEFHEDLKSKNINVSGLKLEKNAEGSWILYAED